MNKNFGNVLPWGILCGLVLALFCIAKSEGLKCYVCTYEEDAHSQKDCEDDPPNSSLQITPDPYTPSQGNTFSKPFFYGKGNTQQQMSGRTIYPYCMKIKGENRKGKDVIIRGIAWSDSRDNNDICQERLPTNLIERDLTDVKTCYCNDEDGCNGAGSLSLALTPFMIALVSYLMK